MNKEKLKELIVTHKEGFLSKKELIPREIQKQSERYLTTKEILLITGVRRSGKSSLMKLICDELRTRMSVPISNILYLNFEDERFTDFTVKDFELLHETFLELENPDGRLFFFLDEIQNVRGWEKWVNRMYELEGIKFFITGSNATLLGSEISTALTGRNIQIVTWPFSFREFLLVRGITDISKDIYHPAKRVGIRRLLKEYIQLGGFPEAVKQNDAMLLEQYFKDILYRDIITRYSLRNVKEIKELCLYLASNIGVVASYENLKGNIHAKNITTIKNYTELLEQVYLFYRIPLFDYSVKRQIYNPGKFYIVDTGMSGAIGFSFSANIGHLYENIVFIELKRKNKEIYYWKLQEDGEVDFIVRKGRKIEEAVQVCFDLSNEKTRQREYESLLRAKSKLNPQRLVVITENEEKEEVIKKTLIKIIPLWKWLLEN